MGVCLKVQIYRCLLESMLQNWSESDVVQNIHVEGANGEDGGV